MENSKRVSVEKLKEFCAYALQTVGLDEKDARTTAEVLVTTDTWGTYSHGTNHLRNYIKKIHAGGISPKAKPEIIEQGPTWAVIDGHAAMGMVSAYRGMEVAIEKATHSVLGYVGVRNSNHFGAAGYYAYMAVKQDMIGISTSNTDANMTAPGSRGSVIGNNPFSYAAPAGEEHPVILDIASSATASTKIYQAKARGDSIPNNWIVDADGLPTTDLTNWPSALLPVGAHKGYGLALLVEILAAVLSGASITHDVKKWLGDTDVPPGTGHGFIAIDVRKIAPLAEFKQRMDQMIRDIKTAPKAKGSARIWLPGEKEWERREVALREGMVMPEIVLNSLAKLSQEVGRDFNDLFV